MPTYPPLPAPSKRDLEEAVDALAYLLATDPRTSGIQWIVGDVGMGNPTGLPFAYVSVQTEQVKWYTANGKGPGGLAAGLDDWLIPITLTVAVRKHQFEQPVVAAPPGASSIGAVLTSVGALPYLEQPGWRAQVEVDQPIKDVLRTNITVGGYVATTNVTDSRPRLITIDKTLYRASVISIQAQQRRTRGT